MTFRTFILWVHISSIVVWLGGVFAVSLVFIPVLTRGAGSPKEVARLVAMTVQRLQKISHEVTLLILLTGIFNFMLAGMAWGFQFGATYMTMLGLKIGLFLAIIAVQIWQTYRLTPAFVSITSQLQHKGDTLPAPAGRLLRRLYATSILNVILGVSAILLGLKLRYR